MKVEILIRKSLSLSLSISLLIHRGRDNFQVVNADRWYRTQFANWDP